LRIHGRGDFADDVQALLKKLNLEGRVELTTDFLSSEALSNLIRTYDVGIIPYRRDVFTDGILPTKLLEYVALGVPAIVARTNVVSHYFTDDTVEFFNPEDIEDLAAHIRRLCFDRERCRQLSGNSDSFNVVYNWPRQRESYVRFVEQTVLQAARS